MSTIVTDTLQGKTTATSITLPTTTNIGSTPLVSASASSMTIRGEGSNTTNVQQGLLKNWANVDQRSTPYFRDSFNSTSLTDQATGKIFVNFTNNMGNDKFCVTTNGGRDVDYILGCRVNEHTTSTYRITSTNNPYGGASQSYVDSDSAFSHCSGDLA